MKKSKFDQNVKEYLDKNEIVKLKSSLSKLVYTYYLNKFLASYYKMKKEYKILVKMIFCIISKSSNSVDGLIA